MNKDKEKAKIDNRSKHPDIARCVDITRKFIPDAKVTHLVGLDEKLPGDPVKLVWERKEKLKLWIKRT